MFKILSKEEFDALTPAQQNYYVAQKKEHDDNELAKKIKDATDTAVTAAVAPFKKTVDDQTEEITNLKTGLSEREKQVESALAEMKRIKVEGTKERAKAIGVEIFDALTSKEGREALEKFKRKEAMSLDVDAAFKAVGVMGVTAGTTQSQWLMPIGIPHEAIQARNIIPVFPTTRDSIKYVQFTKKEGSIGSVAPGTEKPQIDYNSTPKTAPVIKIAGWLTVQEEFIDDVDGAAEWLASELPQAYLDEETRQVFKGGGAAATPDELEGLYSEIATDLALPMGTVTDASNHWDKIAAALTQTRRALRPGDAIWLSPEDYMELLINKGTEEMYTYPIVSDMNGNVSIGGIPIYFHTVFDPGEGLAGNFRRGVALFQKKGITLRSSTEHDKNFTFNLRTFLIEARVAMPVFFPESFVKIDFATS